MICLRYAEKKEKKEKSDGHKYVYQIENKRERESKR